MLNEVCQVEVPMSSPNKDCPADKPTLQSPAYSPKKKHGHYSQQSIYEVMVFEKQKVWQ